MEVLAGYASSSGEEEIGLRIRPQKPKEPQKVKQQKSAKEGNKTHDNYHRDTHRKRSQSPERNSRVSAGEDCDPLQPSTSNLDKPHSPVARQRDSSPEESTNFKSRRKSDSYSQEKSPRQKRSRSPSPRQTSKDRVHKDHHRRKSRSRSPRRSNNRRRSSHEREPGRTVDEFGRDLRPSNRRSSKERTSEEDTERRPSLSPDKQSRRDKSPRKQESPEPRRSSEKRLSLDRRLSPEKVSSDRTWHRKSSERDYERDYDRRDRNRDRDRGRRSSDSYRGRDRYRDRDRDSDRFDRRRDRNRDRDNDRDRYGGRRSRDREHEGDQRDSEKDKTKEPANVKPPATKVYTPAKALTSEQVQAKLAAHAAELKKQAQQTASLLNVPGYINPTVVNPHQFAMQAQKRKLLWSGKKTETTPTGSKVWGGTTFSGDQGGEMQAKFRRLMGIKGESAAPAGGSQSETSQQTADAPQGSKLLADLEMEFERSRAFQLSRGAGGKSGIGLGYTGL